MLEGLYSAAAGMAAQQQRLDTVSNDLANVDTAGYKQVRLSFRDLAYTAEDYGASSRGVRAGAGAAVSDIGRSTAQGAFQVTGRSLDVAIDGPGYLPVRRADGTQALTRSGALELNADRELTTPTGERIEPRIQVPRGTDVSTLTIGRDGTVNAGTRRLGRIVLRDVPAEEGLRSIGDNLYVTTTASGAARPARAATLEQGVLEASNVDQADAMVDLMDAQRSFTLASRAIQTQDQLMEIANGVKR